MGLQVSAVETAVVDFDVEWLLALAYQHAEASSDLQCEVDDLRALTPMVWARLSREQQAKVIASAEVADAVDGEFIAGKPEVGQMGCGWLLGSARAHGEGDDPDHEVGDLQGFIRAMWREMSLQQRRSVVESEGFGRVAEMGGCAREMVSKDDDVDADAWGGAVDHFGLDTSFQYGPQQVADYMNAYTLQCAIENQSAHMHHPMKRGA